MGNTKQINAVHPPANAREFRLLVEKHGKVDAVRISGYKAKSEEDANEWIRLIVNRAFQSRKLDVAATILWGQDVFNFEIGVVKRVWNAYFDHGLLLIQAGSSLAKTYTLIGALYLDWQSDPQWTSVKLISVTGEHASKNAFSTLATFHRQALIPMAGRLNTESLLFSPEDKRMGFTLLRIPDGESAGNVVQGLHPITRDKEHPVFGKSSRERLYIDEAEDCPKNLWRGVANFRSSQSGNEVVKVLAPFNPKDIASPVAQIAQPKDGGIVGHDGPKEWEGREGWYVVRLDARESENVQQRKLVFPNLHTWESYAEKMSKAGGNSLERWAYVHGVYPPSIASNNIFSPELIEKCKGTFLFYEGTERAFGGDLALEGRDEAMAAIGRCGMASQFKHINGTITKFKQVRFCAQLEQFIPLEKGETKVVAASIIQTAKSLSVKGRYIALDATGNGRTPSDLVALTAPYGEVHEIDFGAQPSENRKILEEDKLFPADEYRFMNTELLYALQKWMDFGYFAIAPTAFHEMFFEELLGRKYKLSDLKKTEAEEKREFKKRLGRSPDRLDAATLFCHACRVNSTERTSMRDEKPRSQEREFVPQHGPTDAVEWIEGV